MNKEILRFLYQDKHKQASIWERDKGKGTAIVGGWKIGPDKKSKWSIIKETFFTPLGSHNTPRKARSRKSPRRDAESFPEMEFNFDANEGNSCRNLLTKIIRSKLNQYRGKFSLKVLEVKCSEILVNILCLKERKEVRQRWSPPCAGGGRERGVKAAGPGAGTTGRSRRD